MEHNSEEDIVSYLVNWNKRRNLHYFDAAPELVAQSHAVTNRVFTELGRTQSELPDYSEPMIVDYYNAEDYVFQNPYPDTDRTTVTRVLDFGAGFGRQLNMWSQNVPKLVFCGMDAIEGGYLTQNFLPCHRSACIFSTSPRQLHLARGFTGHCGRARRDQSEVWRFFA